MQVEGVLTILESERFIDAAENLDFLPTKTRGPAYGEVRMLLQAAANFLT